MKNVKTLLAAGLLALLTACGTTKTPPATTPPDTPAPNSSRGRSNTDVNNTNTNTNTASRSNTETSAGRTDSANANTSVNNRTTNTKTDQSKNEAARKAKMEKMYTDLNMTDGQRTRYESQWNSATGNRLDTMNDFERTEIQDKIMKDILDDAQFGKYQQWARDNAGSSPRD